MYFAPMHTILGGLLVHAVLVGGSHSFPPPEPLLIHSFAEMIDANDAKLLTSSPVPIPTSSAPQTSRRKNRRQKKATPQHSTEVRETKTSSSWEKALKELQVFQVGCGATGCETAKILCEMGVGREKTIVMTDGDAFSPSNMNRQFLCFTSSGFRSKAEVAGKSLQQYFPKQRFSSHQRFVSESSMDSFSPEFYQQQD